MLVSVSLTLFNVERNNNLTSPCPERAACSSDELLYHNITRKVLLTVRFPGCAENVFGGLNALHGEHYALLLLAAHQIT